MVARESDVRKCQECGTRLPYDPNGLGPCPVCLMRIGLESEADAMGNASTQSSDPKTEAPSIASLQPLFPQFDFLRIVGRGGMGAVYQVRQKSLDRVVALKIVLPNEAKAQHLDERFEREAKSLAKLNHRNIVTVHDFGVAEFPSDGQEPATGSDKQKIFYFVMEYVEGVNLRDLIRRKTLQPSEALRIIPSVCDALQYAHDRGVVHRDIKPENILIDESGEVKIADFGLAKLIDSDPKSSLTRTFQAMGTPHYMAPEQMERPMEVDHRVDIYALGVTLYELLTGELPLGRFAPPSRKVHVDVRLDEIVLRALQREPELRYQKISDIKSDMHSLSQGSDVANQSAHDNDDEVDDPAIVASARDSAFFIGGTIAAYFAKYTFFEPARTWLPLFCFLCLAMISLLQAARGRSDRRGILMLNALVAILLAAILTMHRLVEIVPYLINFGQPGVGDVTMWRLWCGFFAAWALIERAILEPTSGHDLALRRPSTGPRPPLTERIGAVWLLWPRPLRIVVSLIIAVVTLACCLQFISFSASRKPDAFEHAFGRPDPWLKLRVEESGMKWEVDLLNQSVFMLGLATMLIYVDNFLGRVEGRRLHSNWWIGVSIGFALSISPILSLLAIVLSLRAELDSQGRDVLWRSLQLMTIALLLTGGLCVYSAYRVYCEHRSRMVGEQKR
ncbi:MAG: serine/threonine-protein kinase [Pirellulaceae bacterium]